MILAARGSIQASYGEAVRALSDNRDRYIEQSRMTEAGKLAELPPVKNWTDSIGSAWDACPDLR